MNKTLDKITPDMKPLKTAIICPVDSNSLSGAIISAQKGLMVPILIGQRQAIQQTAKKESFDLGGFEIIDAPDNESAALMGVELVKQGRAEALMKGLLPTHVFLAPIVSKEASLRTSRRMSHVFCLSDPDYPKSLYISDCAVNNMRGVNIEKDDNPDENLDLIKNVKVKKDIVQNVIDFFISIEGRTPKVSLISATEKISTKFPCSIEAAKLAEMSQKGEITGGMVAGPFALDIAVSKEAAKIKGITSEVAGNSDILILPDLVSGNIFYKGLTKLSDAKRGGIVLGAKIPVILTSRMADTETRLISTALAMLSFRSQRKAA